MTLRATYRLQFHKGFTFADAERRVSYFASLGISHIYSSPILAARAGSPHGYDVVDHAHINPELGGETAFRSLATALRRQDIAILLDIVPNHMAVGGSDNPYWLDLLEKGRASVFANMFDIDWDSEAESAIERKVVVPMLGKPLAECLAAGDIALVWDHRLNKLAFAYGDNLFPVRLDDYSSIITPATDPGHADLTPFSDPRALARLLAHQHYRLVYWRDAGDRINWRRFFDVTDLAALRVEDDAVFEQTHATIFRVFSEGLIDGVRIDHVDGLANPAAYCRRLRARLEALSPQRPEDLPRQRAIVLVEKVLAEGEHLPADWDVDGTTGYDFMNAVSGLQHDPASADAFTRLWTESSSRSPEFECEEQQARGELLGEAFANALRTTAAAFAILMNPGGHGAMATELALAKLIEHFRAYRTYALGDSSEPPPGDMFERAVATARGALSAERDVADALEGIADVVRGAGTDQPAAARDAVRRFNQLAASIAAKAVEDTALYRYGRLLSRNDVGFNPGRFSISPASMHAENEARAAAFPFALLATATHDHKRGEDARARLAALSELPNAWDKAQREWVELDAATRPPGVALKDEYQLYQTLVGAWPLDLSPFDTEAIATFTDRITGWRRKSLREAKLETSWAQPNETVESAHRDFIRGMFVTGHPFSVRLATFVSWLGPAGALNGLVASVLRCTSPGAPDLYQGAELWDLSLVDPDNRRPVDFDRREIMLSGEGQPATLLSDWKTGGVKLAVIHRLLSLRARLPDLFSSREYVPVECTNPRIFSFARTSGSQVLLVAVPRLCASSAIARGLPLPGDELGTGVGFNFPHEWRSRRWRDGLDPDTPYAELWSGGPLFAGFPAAVIFSQ